MSAQAGPRLDMAVGRAPIGATTATTEASAQAAEVGETAGSIQARRSMALGLQKRLLVLLILPLLLLALVSGWIDYRTANTAALRQDAQLLQLVPLLADSIIVPDHPGSDLAMLMAPPVDEFIKDRHGDAAWSVSTLGGGVLLGAPWLEAQIPTTRQPEFHSREQDGVTYRIVAQRLDTPAGEMVIQLADGSDPRQHWRTAVLLRVFLPNLVLLAATALAMHFAVRRGLRPLIELRSAVERRSPRDLSAIDEHTSPDEVRPLVESLNRLFVLVNAQSESQRRFVADAAHQLRTPLAGLQAQVEAWSEAANRAGGTGRASAVLLARNASAALDGSITLRAAELRSLRDATRRTSQLAHQLLTLSRADAHALHGQAAAWVHVGRLCSEMIELHFEAAAARGIDLGLEAQPLFVQGHQWLLRELLGNLVQNAIKYTPENGRVTIRCAPTRDEIGRFAALLEVEDDGPGVPQAERERVLQRFYRVPGTKGEGTGLGLAIAEEIALVHHSRLELRPGEFGRGLRVSVMLRAWQDGPSPSI
jgi:two-component system sensor histidine kinase TctE